MANAYILEIDYVLELVKEHIDKDAYSRLTGNESLKNCFGAAIRMALDMLNETVVKSKDTQFDTSFLRTADILLKEDGSDLRQYFAKYVAEELDILARVEADRTDPVKIAEQKYYEEHYKEMVID